MHDYRLDCKAAVKRFEEGIPGVASSVDDSAKTIAETVQYFITVSRRIELSSANFVFVLNNKFAFLCR